MRYNIILLSEFTMMRPCFCCCMFKHYVTVGEKLLGKATGFHQSMCWECYVDYERNKRQMPELTAEQHMRRARFIRQYRALYRVKMRDMFGAQRYARRA